MLKIATLIFGNKAWLEKERSARGRIQTVAEAEKRVQLRATSPGGLRNKNDSLRVTYCKVALDIGATLQMLKNCVQVPGRDRLSVRRACVNHAVEQ